MTNPSLTGTTAGPACANALLAKGASVRAAALPSAPFTMARRFSSNTGDLAAAVGDALHLQARLVEDREVQIGNRRVFGKVDLLSALLERARAAADEDVRQRIIAVHVAVAHVGAVEQHRIVQERAFAVGRGGELLDEIPEPLHVIALDLHQLLEPVEVIGMMRQRMEGVRHADEIIGP